MSWSWLRVVSLGLLQTGLLLTPAAVMADYELVGPNFDRFTYTFRDFTQTPTADGVRISDQVDDSGGVGTILGSVDLTACAEGRLVVEFATLPTNGADSFAVQLLDVDGNTRRWDFLSSGGEPSELQRLAASKTIGSPDANVGSTFDLGAVRQFQIIGSYTNPVPFDIDLRSLVISNSEPAPDPYPGYDSDDSWRSEANDRIDALRKADLSVQVVDAAGRPLPNASVHVLMTEHEFLFGTAVQARRIDSQTSENLDYQDKTRELFNAAVLENAMKWIAYEGDYGSDFMPDRADATVAWLLANQMDVRGHNLVWPGERWTPASVRPLIESKPVSAENQQELRNRITSHITEIATRYAGTLSSWDVVNEPRAERDLIEAFDEGDLVMAEWFAAAAAADPQAKRYLNDYGILDSRGGINTANQRLLLEQAFALREAGAPLDGVGLEAHFRGDKLTGPRQLWRILDRYVGEGLDIQITEFDHETTNETLQAAYMRDFLTAMFAHEGVSQITQWGFWENAHWRPDAALYRSDWSIKPNGEAYLALVQGEWWTNEVVQTDTMGSTLLRAFKGDHEVNASFGGEHAIATALISDNGATLTLKIAFLTGDFNRDGLISFGDLLTWFQQLFQTVAEPGLGADADGNGFVGISDLFIWVDAFLADAYAPEEEAPTATDAEEDLEGVSEEEIAIE